MTKFRVLVFPCGSEIGLEIHRSLRHSSHIDLIGASSVDDHGKFVYERYIGGLPFIDSADAIGELRKQVVGNGIDAIYPAMDSVICALKKNETKLGCRVISSKVETAEICLAKSKTYSVLHNDIRTPKLFRSIHEVDHFPVFIKPDVGYGARGTCKAQSEAEAASFLQLRESKHIIMEFLPGDEYTIDCFTDRHGRLLFVGPRQRNRVMNGISVNTSPVRKAAGEFNEIARIINKKLSFRGAWFFQTKRDGAGQLTLLEVASRLGGSSALYRGLGVNFALLSVFDAFDIDVEVRPNAYEIELDRALCSQYRVGIRYSTIYVDFDDCLVVNGVINTQLVGFLYACVNAGKKIILITKHENNIGETLREYRLGALFDEVIQIRSSESKADYVRSQDAIFIDDSFQERKQVSERKGIPVFSLDMIETLISL